MGLRGEVSVSGPAKALFNGPLKTLKRQTQMCVRAEGQQWLRRERSDLKWGKVVKECLRTKLFEGGRYETRANGRTSGEIENEELSESIGRQ